MHGLQLMSLGTIRLMGCCNWVEMDCIAFDDDRYAVKQEAMPIAIHVAIAIDAAP